MIFYTSIIENRASRGSRGRGSIRGRGSRGRHNSSDGHQSGIPRLQLTHVEVAFLPPNTTSHLQPLDAGIIASFKSHFKRKYCRHMLDLFEDGKDINSEKINIKEAINYIAEAWRSVTEETIGNCWRKTGILPSLTDEDINDASQIQQETMDDEATDINQMINELNTEDPSAALLADALNDFFHDLEEIPTEDVLSDDDILKLIQEETHDEDNNSDSEEEEILVPPGDALRSLQTWIKFFEQQHIDKF